MTDDFKRRRRELDEEWKALDARWDEIPRAYLAGHVLCIVFLLALVLFG